MAGSPRSGERTITWGTGASQGAASCQPVRIPCRPRFRWPSWTRVVAALRTRGWCQEPQQVLPPFRRWGSAGASPPGLLPNGMKGTVPPPVPGPASCDSAVCLYLFWPSHHVSARLPPLCGRDLFSLCFSSAGLLLLAAPVWAGGSHLWPWPP